MSSGRTAKVAAAAAAAVLAACALAGVLLAGLGDQGAAGQTPAPQYGLRAESARTIAEGESIDLVLTRPAEQAQNAATVTLAVGRIGNANTAADLNLVMGNGDTIMATVLGNGDTITASVMLAAGETSKRFSIEAVDDGNDGNNDEGLEEFNLMVQGQEATMLDFGVWDAADIIMVDSTEDFHAIGSNEANPLNGYYRLTKDLPLPPGSGYIGFGEQSIGEDGACLHDACVPGMFQGTFDGQGHTLSNFKLDFFHNADGRFRYFFPVGLFEEIGARGTVRNVALEDFEVARLSTVGEVPVGALAGRSAGLIEGVRAGFELGMNGRSGAGVVAAGTGVVGGLVGELAGGTLRHVEAGPQLLVGSPWAAYHADNMPTAYGGLVGRLSGDAVIEHSRFSGSIGSGRQNPRLQDPGGPVHGFLAGAAVAGTTIRYSYAAPFRTSGAITGLAGTSINSGNFDYVASPLVGMAEGALRQAYSSVAGDPNNPGDGALASTTTFTGIFADWLVACPRGTANAGAVAWRLGSASQTPEPTCHLTGQDNDPVYAIRSSNVAEGAGQFSVTLFSANDVVVVDTVTAMVTLNDQDGLGIMPETQLMLELPRGASVSPPAVVQFADNDADNLDREVGVTLTSVSRGTVSTDPGQSSLTVTVTDDDLPLFEFGAMSANVTAAEGGTVMLEVVANGSGPAASAVVEVELAPGAPQGQLSVTAGRLEFAAGDTTKSATLMLTDDLIEEGEVEVALVLRARSGAGLGARARAVVRIEASDVPTVPRVFGFAMDSRAPMVDEDAGEHVLTVRLLEGDPLLLPVTLDVAYGGNAGRRTGLGARQVTIGAGETEVDLTLLFGADNVFTGDVVREVSLSFVDGPGVGSATILAEAQTARVTVVEQLEADGPRFRFAADSLIQRVAEGDQFTLRLEHIPTSPPLPPGFSQVYNVVLVTSNPDDEAGVGERADLTVNTSIYRVMATGPTAESMAFTVADDDDFEEAEELEFRLIQHDGRPNEARVVIERSDLPTEINSAGDLGMVNQNLAGNYILTSDIHVGGGVSIGDKPGTERQRFTGTFDGGGFTISGVNIDAASPQRAATADQGTGGFFNHIGQGGVVRNLTLSVNRVTASSSAGGVAGVNEGTISNVHVVGVHGSRCGRENFHDNGIEAENISGSAGGIAGLNQPTGVILASSSREVYVCGGDSGSSGGNVGGIAGWNAGRIEASVATGHLASTGRFFLGTNADFGGIAGENVGTGAGLGIFNSYATVDVSELGNLEAIGEMGGMGSHRFGGVAGGGGGTVEASYQSSSPTDLTEAMAALPDYRLPTVLGPAGSGFSGIYASWDANVCPPLSPRSGFTVWEIDGGNALPRLACADAPPEPTLYGFAVTSGRLAVPETPSTLTLDVELTLGDPSSSPVTLGIEVGTGGTTEGVASEFLRAPASVTIPAGMRSAQIEVTVIDDDDFNADRVLTVTLEVLSGASGVDVDSLARQAVITVVNEDIAVDPNFGLTLESQDLMLVEGSDMREALTLTLLSGLPHSSDVVVEITSAVVGDGAAGAGLEFMARVTIPAGTTGTTFTVGANDDSEFTGDRQHELTLRLAPGTAQNVVLVSGRNTAMVSVEEDEPPPPARYRFSAAERVQTVEEGNDAEFPLEFVSGTAPGAEAMLNFNVVVTQLAGADEGETVDDELGAPPILLLGRDGGTLVVPVLNDRFSEGEQRFRIELVPENPALAEAILNPEGALLTVPANDAPIMISSRADLMMIGNNASHPLDGNYFLTQDISDTAFDGNVAGSNQFSIPGPFEGDFDGRGHAIINFTAGNTTIGDRSPRGLFNELGRDGIVRNLVLVDPAIYTHSGSAGAVAGVSAGTIRNVAVYRTPEVRGGCNTVRDSSDPRFGSVVTSTGRVGGIAGHAIEGGLIENVYSNLRLCTTSIVGKSEFSPPGIEVGAGAKVGGVAGELRGTDVRNARTAGEIVERGLMIFESGAKTQFSITLAGGIAGDIQTGTVSNSYSTLRLEELGFRGPARAEGFSPLAGRSVPGAVTSSYQTGYETLARVDMNGNDVSPVTAPHYREPDAFNALETFTGDFEGWDAVPCGGGVAGVDELPAWNLGGNGGMPFLNCLRGHYEVTGAPAGVDEGDEITLTLTRNLWRPGTEFTVNLSGVPGAMAPAEVIGGAESVEVLIELPDQDNVTDAERVLAVDVAPSTSGSALVTGGSVRVAVTDLDVPRYGFAAGSRALTRSEAAGLVLVEAVQLNAGTYRSPEPVRLTLTGSGTGAAAEHSEFPAEFVIPSGNVRVQVPVTLVQTRAAEADRTLTLTLGLDAGQAGMLGSGAAVRSVLQIEDGHRGVFQFVRVDSGVLEEGEAAVFEIRRTQGQADTQFRVSVPPAIGRGSGDLEFPEMVTLGAAERSRRFSVRVVDDSADEFEERFDITLELVNASEGTLSGARTHQIRVAESDRQPLTVRTPAGRNHISGDGNVGHNTRGETVLLRTDFTGPLTLDSTSQLHTGILPSGFYRVAGCERLTDGEHAEAIVSTTGPSFSLRCTQSFLFPGNQLLPPQHFTRRIRLGAQQTGRQDEFATERLVLVDDRPSPNDVDQFILGVVGEVLEPGHGSAMLEVQRVGDSDAREFTVSVARTSDGADVTADFEVEPTTVRIADNTNPHPQPFNTSREPRSTSGVPAEIVLRAMPGLTVAAGGENFTVSVTAQSSTSARNSEACFRAAVLTQCDATQATGTAEVSVMPSGTLPVFGFTGATAQTAEEGEGATFNFGLTGGNAETATFRLSLSGDGADGVSIAGESMITLGPGNTTASVVLETAEDALSELDRVATLTAELVQGGGEYTVDPAEVTLTVEEDDVRSTLRVEVVGGSAQEGGMATIRVTAAPPPGADVPVTLDLADNELADVAALLPLVGTLPARQSFVDIQVPILDDLDREPAETLQFTLATSAHADLAQVSAAATDTRAEVMVDASDRQVVSAAVPMPLAEEGGMVEVHVTRDNPAAGQVVFDVALEDGAGGPLPSGVVVSPPSTFDFDGGVASAVLTLTLSDNTVEEVTRTVRVRLTPQDAMLTNMTSAEFMIRESDLPEFGFLDAELARDVDAGGMATWRFGVTNGVTELRTARVYTFALGGAEGFAVSAGETLTLSGTTLSGSVTVTAPMLGEGEELTAMLTALAVGGAPMPSPSAATLTAEDAPMDTTPVVPGPPPGPPPSPPAPPVNPGPPAPAGNPQLEFMVSVSGGAVDEGGEATVTLERTMEGTAVVVMVSGVGDAADELEFPMMVEVDAEELTAEFAVAARADGEAEGTERYALVLTGSGDGEDAMFDPDRIEITVNDVALADSQLFSLLVATEEAGPGAAAASINLMRGGSSFVVIRRPAGADRGEIEFDLTLVGAGGADPAEYFVSVPERIVLPRGVDAAGVLLEARPADAGQTSVLEFTLSAEVRGGALAGVRSDATVRVLPVPLPSAGGVAPGAWWLAALLAAGVSLLLSLPLLLRRRGFTAT